MNTRDNEVGTSRLTRRTALRVGAGAAWAVPAVTLVTAAPAAAWCSRPAADISTTTATATTDGLAMTIGLAVVNTGAAATEPWLEVAFAPVGGAFGWTDAGAPPADWLVASSDRRRVSYRLATPVPAAGVVMATFAPTMDVEAPSASVEMHAVGSDADCDVPLEAKQTVAVA